MTPKLITISVAFAGLSIGISNVSFICSPSFISSSSRSRVGIVTRVCAPASIPTLLKNRIRSSASPSKLTVISAFCVSSGRQLESNVKTSDFAAAPLILMGGVIKWPFQRLIASGLPFPSQSSHSSGSETAPLLCLCHHCVPL